MRSVVAAVLSCLTLTASCTAEHGSTGPSSPRSNAGTSAPSRPSATCPWAGGDAAVGSPTLVAPLNRKLHGRLTVLAHTTPAHATTVHAVVTANSRPDGVRYLVDSRIVLTRQAFETFAAARGIADQLIDNPDHLLWASNVVASSRHVRTTDMKDHELTLVVPRGLPPRDYFVIAVQNSTPQCTPRGTGSAENVIGLVRVLTRDGRIARLRPPPPHVH
jgi:hypothetical protein